MKLEYSLTWHDNLNTVIVFDLIFHFLLLMVYLTFPDDYLSDSLVILLEFVILLLYHYILYSRLKEGKQKFRKNLAEELYKHNIFYIALIFASLLSVIQPDFPNVNTIFWGIMAVLMSVLIYSTIKIYSIEVSGDREEWIRNTTSYFVLFGVLISIMRPVTIKLIAMILPAVIDALALIFIFGVFFAILVTIPALAVVLGVNRGINLLNRRIWELDNVEEPEKQSEEELGKNH